MLYTRCVKHIYLNIFFKFRNQWHAKKVFFKYFLLYFNHRCAAQQAPDISLRFL